jgi:hypothetical protein
MHQGQAVGTISFGSSYVGAKNKAKLLDTQIQIRPDQSKL